MARWRHTLALAVSLHIAAACAAPWTVSGCPQGVAEEDASAVSLLQVGTVGTLGGARRPPEATAEATSRRAAPSRDTRNASWLQFGVAPSLLQAVGELKESDLAVTSSFSQVFASAAQRGDESSVYALTLLLIGGVACTGAIIVGVFVKDQWRSPQMVRGDPATQSHLMALSRLNLCGDALVVPREKRFECQVASRFHSQRQTECVEVTSSPQRGRRTVFKVSAAEGDQERDPRILIEGAEAHSQGGLPFAYISTGALYRRGGAGAPKLGVYRGNGELFGTLQRRGANYEIVRGQHRLIEFSGNFAAHDITVSQIGGGELGRVQAVPNNAQLYQAIIPSGVDAGLVILGLLAIDKCEIRAPEASDLPTSSAPRSGRWW